MADDVAMADSLQTVGDEWAPTAHVQEVVEAFIMVSGFAAWFSPIACPTF